ncbi:ABC transporter ATP-binding protein [Pseudogulbenkiania ferrooxidans]|uniref:Spermidine/putrescine import ATP-binding protein PotA n=1 Tax=Pseudogulbenkiania ferrooxidans 2002 TaxID=279714 RepID=B9Z8N2_9NEIS|nr:ABC transporter ATP-binding protein [Pseudogulbenkiania ferrooxidans]EEG06815.1 spermidine/putrescine ABC transporter ATPase subunit [Pseudogulbenkiania ferrooxidans 2002]
MVPEVVPDNEVLVSFRGVQKSYDGESLIVKHLDLDIRKGEFLTLLGPSGSGKTTCLMMLAGFETPTHGEIRLNGALLNHVPPHKRNIGMVFQNYALFPHMTVGENLAYPLKIRNFSKSDIDAKVMHALSMVKLEKLAHRYPAQLSGGQQQRVALARALVFNPQLVLMDEPLGALDKQLREHMQMEIKHIHDSLGVTVVYVTHDQGEALTMSDRVAVFKDGIIQQIDSAYNLYEAPVNSFVASFIGENNTLEGEVQSLQDGLCQVKLGDGIGLTAKAVCADRAGARTTMSIRPERVRLNGASEQCANRFQGKLQEFIYFGDHVRLRMDVAGNPSFIVKVPVSELDGSWSVGDSIALGWNPEDIRALDPLNP